MIDATIIYYTNNVQDPEFEKIVQKKLIESSKGMPIISVSHKPIDLGTNICVGEQHSCDANLYRQILIGAEAAKTPFIINAEADTLYPPEYFEFEPPRLDLIYRYTNVYIYSPHHRRFYKKKMSEGAQIAGREYLIDLLSHRMKTQNIPYWSKEGDQKFKNPYPKSGKVWEPYWKEHPDIKSVVEPYESENPVVSIKATGNMRKRSTWDKTVAPVYEVPYWGHAEGFSWVT